MMLQFSRTNKLKIMMFHLLKTNIFANMLVRVCSSAWGGKGYVGCVWRECSLCVCVYATCAQETKQCLWACVPTPRRCALLQPPQHLISAQYYDILWAACCSVLPRAARCCIVSLCSVLLQRVAASTALDICTVLCQSRSCASQCVAVCCSVLQCVAVCCSVLQCVVVCFGVLQCCVAECYSVLQRVAACSCNVLQPSQHSIFAKCNDSSRNHKLNESSRVNQCVRCVAVFCSVLQCVTECWSVLQCVAVCCSVLQCVAVCYN